MNFLVDAQLPIALSEWLCSLGHDSIHTLSLPNQNRTSDTEILNHAEKENRIILSKDVDFYESFILQGRPKKLLLITTGNISNQELLKIFQNNLNKIIQLFDHHLLIEMDKNNLTVHR